MGCLYKKNCVPSVVNYLFYIFFTIATQYAISVQNSLRIPTMATTATRNKKKYVGLKIPALCQRNETRSLKILKYIFMLFGTIKKKFSFNFSGKT